MRDKNLGTVQRSLCKEETSSIEPCTHWC